MEVLVLQPAESYSYPICAHVELNATSGQHWLPSGLRSLLCEITIH